jgi:hypothetical protein
MDGFNGSATILEHSRARYTYINMSRPIGVTVTAILMAFNALADVATTFIGPHAAVTNPHPHGPVSLPIVVAVHIALVGVIIFGCVTVWYYWRGRFWARWIALGGCAYYLTGLRLLPGQLHRASLYAAELSVFSAVLSAFLVWYLFTSDVRAWFARPVAEPALDESLNRL